jgi:serine/threonine protein kinase
MPVNVPDDKISAGTAGLSSEEWRRVWELSETALALPAQERRAFLESAQVSRRILEEVLELVGEFPSSSESHPPVDPLAAGTKVGHFVITGRLGRGGMGEVYSAADTELGRPVALKFLTPEILGFHGAVQKFIREAQTASALNHPNIVTIHEVIRSDSAVAIVMELVEGVSLRCLCETSIPTARLLDIGQQIALALAAAHDLGIVHRDIKPENILVRPDGRVKVLDFGLARPILRDPPSSLDSLPAGTLRYMSPEQLHGDSVSPASDVFSLGLVLHELATAAHAFPADSPLETAHAILTSDLSGRVLAGRVPPQLDLLIRSMLVKTPAARPSAAQVAQELGQMRESSAEQFPNASRPAPGRLWIRVALVAAVLMMAGYLVWTALGRRSDNQFADLRIQPLTSQDGWEAAPALSPDGQSIAFTWTAKLDRPKEIYVKRKGEAEPFQLTHSASGNIGYLVWSPDGGRIAFKRQFETSGAIYAIPSAGGSESKIVDLANANLSSSIDWSPDGTQIAFGDFIPLLDRMALYLYNLHTGEKRKLTSPPERIWGDWNPKFSPDGRTVAFKRVTGFWADDIYIVPVAGGVVRRLTTDQRGIWGHAWTPDGKGLILSCQRNSTIFGIWRFSILNPSRPERLVQGGGDVITPATSRGAGRMAWVNQLWDLNIYRAPTTRAGAPIKLIGSTVRDQGAVYSSTGRIAFISDRSGSREIWIANNDGSGETRVTNFNGPQIDHLAWSPDGRHLAFDSRPSGYADIFTLTCAPDELRCGQPQRLAAASPAEAPGWSADGEFVYFAAARFSDRWEIWKQPLSSGAPVQVTHNGGFLSRESSDGKWLYFVRHGGDSIWRMPGSHSAGGGSGEEMVVGPPYRVQAEGWALSSRELVFIDRPTKTRSAAIRGYNLATRQVRSILELKEVFPDRGDIGVSISPDSRWILYSQLDRSGSNVMVAENSH